MIMLDMSTIVFSNAITDIVCMLVIIRLWQQSSGRFAGAGFFAIDYVLQTSALILIISRGSISPWISYVLANTMVIAGALLGYMGLLRFAEKKSSQIHNYIMLVAFALIHSYFTFIQPNLAARNLNLAMGLLIICSQCSWLLLYGIEPGKRQLTRGTGIVFLAYCAVSVIRIVEYFTVVNPQIDYLHSGIFEQIVLFSYQMLFILLTYSLIMIFNKSLLVDVKAGEEKFYKAFHSSPYAILITRLSDGMIIEANDSFLKMTGFQLTDMMGRTTFDFYLWDKNEDRAFVINEPAIKERILEREILVRNKAGQMITCLLSAEIITVKNEKCILYSINDITERKRLEAQIRERMKELQAFFNLSEIIERNGITLDELYEEFAKILPASWQHTEVACARIVIGRKEFRTQNFAESRWMQSSPVKVNEKVAGRIDVGYLEERPEQVEGPFLKEERLLIDALAERLGRITELRRLETAIKESEHRNLNLIEKLNEAQHVASIGSWEWNLQTNLVWWSDETYQIFGVTKQNFIPGFEENARFIHPDDFEKYKKTFEHCLQTGEPLSLDLRIVTPEGRGKYCHAAGQIIFDDSGQKNRFIGTLMDITERKREEEEIQRLNAELEKKVTERTRELHDSQLALLNLVDDLNQSAKNTELANQKLEETNKELAAFSYSVSHDLRAPLRSIDGFSLALLDDYQEKLDDTGRKYLNKIRASTQHMGLLIEDMLKLSRITHAEFRHESIDLSKLVKSIAETFRQNNPDRDMKIIIQEGTVVNGDYNSMQIALTNLLENAWKFTGKQNNPLIEFGTITREGKNIFFIRDNGVGFNMAYVNRLFGAFQRLHGKDEFPGTGIGLATVKRIISRHGGQIWAEGEIGKGAAFYFTIPE